MRDITSAPYYVNKYACDGKNCRYTGIKILDVSNMQLSSWEIMVSNGAGESVSITNRNITQPENRAEAASSIYESICRDIKHIGATAGLDIVCVTQEPNPEYLYGYGIIYIRHGYRIELTGNYSNHIDYLMDGDNRADIYHLCHNISINFGRCKNSSEGKYSNIYSGKEVITEGDKDRLEWRIGSIPIIMNNCAICEYCITYCPRKAINNKINDKPISLTSLSIQGDGGYYEMLSEQYKANSKAVDGKYVYGSGGDHGGSVMGGNIYISETQPSSPTNNDIWFDLNLVRRS